MATKIRYILLLCCFSFPGCAGPDTVGIMGRGFPLPVFGTYTYDIDSKPVGADVYMNGELKGKTPLTWKRTLLFQTIEKIELKASMTDYQDGVVTGIQYSGKPSNIEHAQVVRWGSNVSLVFILPLLPEVAYKKACEADTLAEYRQFIKKYPTDEHVKEIEAKIEEMIWDSAADTVEACEQYVRDYPAGKHVKEVAARREEAVYKEASVHKTVLAYDKYLKEYPNGSHASMVTALREEAVFTDAEKTSGYDHYLKEYPHGKYASNARKLKEEALFKESKENNTLKSYTRYLEKYPHGTYASEVKRRIRSLALIQADKKRKYNDESDICDSDKNSSLSSCRTYPGHRGVRYFKKGSDGVYHEIGSPPEIVCRDGVIYKSTGWRCSSLAECVTTSNPALYGDYARNVMIMRE